MALQKAVKAADTISPYGPPPPPAPTEPTRKSHSYHRRSSSSSTYSTSNSSNTSNYNRKTTSRTFVIADYVLHYLAHQTFTNGTDIDIRFDGEGRMYIDGDYAGVISVLRYNATSAMLKYSGGLYGEGRIGVSIVNDRLRLHDPLDGTTWYQR